MNMIVHRSFFQLLIVASGIALLIATWTLGGYEDALAEKTGPRKGPVRVPLPAGLFVKDAPTNPLSVSKARQVAQEGKPIVIAGRIGGTASPFAQNRAIFLLADNRLPLCQEGCATPWDYCCETRQTIISNLATVQVIDQQGRAVKVGLHGLNGLVPAAEIVVRGTVAKAGKNLLVLNAQNIYVKPQRK
jgi:hypothetical protein